MKRFLHTLWLAIAPGFFAMAMAQSHFGFDWTSEDFEVIYADFDGDSQLDTLLLSKRSDSPSWFLSGTAHANPTQHWQSFDPSLEYLVAGDFDNDSRSELLVMQNDLSGRYLELDEDDSLVEGEQKLKVAGYNKNRQINFTHLFKGDFNGDTSDDLLAYASDTHDIVVFHNAEKNKKIKFKFDAQLFLEDSNSLTLKVSDFNEDGMEDIALLSLTEDGTSYVAFAGKKGRFKKSDFEDITPYLGGESLSAAQHTIRMWTNPQNGERQILRVANAAGGYDEEGNWIAEDSDIVEDKVETTGHSVNASTEQSCLDLAYSPLHKQISNVCDTATTDTDALQAMPMTLSGAQFQDSGDKSGGVTASASAPSTPSSASAVIQNGDDIKISWSSVSSATYYNREVSLNGGGWQNTKTYNAPQTSVIFYDQQARSYKYRIRACNGSGCSSWRETGTVTIAATLPVPATPGSAPSVSGGSYHPVNANYRVNISSITNATRYDIYVGTSSSNVSPNGGGSGTSFNVWSGGSYGYRYIKYRACNATGCSGLSPWKRIYIYTNPGAPKNLSASTTALNIGGSSTITWSQAGGQINSGYFMFYETRPGQAESHIATINASGSSYSRVVTPSGSFGTYTYRVRACNPSPYCGSSSTVSVSLNNRNPVADNESASVDEGGSVNINVLSGDSDPDGHSISISGNSNPSKGSVSCSGSYCNYTATNNISSNTSDSFTYTISDGHGGTATGTVSVSIRNLSEGTVAKPVISPSGKVFTGSQSISISTSTSGATIYYTTNGSNPTTSSTRYTGAFTISSDTTIKAFVVKPDYNNSAVDTDVFDRNYAPVANSDNVTMDEDTSKTINVLGNDTDAENDTLSLHSVQAASHGATAKNGNQVTYTPNANYCGADSFTYIVSDGLSTSTGTVTMTITCLPETPQRKVVFIHTDLLGSPAAETDENGNLQ